MYGCETCTLLKSKQNKFLIFERKILKRIVEPCQDEGTVNWIMKNPEK